ncbi:stage V sporulation protein SpoVM [Jeotgalibacillus salarius]|uniref:Stage V sporulation protein SpoVM n=1 Tax=Jeotgalibacillus salarius TaxID=546023 RepID=A0A4Y8LKU9_9BACL|nr:stage V sporulation protein SpoVM [Jeotgalibacillus salarius]
MRFYSIKLPRMLGGMVRGVLSLFRKRAA